MALYEVLSWLSRIVFLVVFALTLVEAIRKPTREHTHIAFLFGSIALAVVLSTVSRVLTGPVPGLIGIGTAVVAIALPLMLLRIVDDFAPVPRRAHWLMWAGFVPSAIFVALVRPPYPTAFTLWILAYFVLATAYSTLQFARRLGASRGVRRRRKQAVVLGSSFLALSIFLSVLANFVPTVLHDAVRSTGSLASFTCAISYFLGFAPPHWVRRAWEAPEVERFLSVLTSAIGVPLPQLTQQLETAVAGAIGSERALISLWSEEEARLRAPTFTQPVQPPSRANSSAAFDVFVTQKPQFVDNMIALHPENEDVYRSLGMLRAMLSPITSGNRRLGVLTVYGFDAPLFPDDGLTSLTMMAKQIAIVLAARQSAEEVAQATARAEMVKLHDEFLAAASHDLRTPLTTILGESQLLQRRLRRVTPTPHELEAVDVLVSQALRMRRLTEDIMNVMQDSGGFVGDRTPTDLKALVEEVANGTNTGGREIHIEGTSAFAPLDATRASQVIANLIDNALKYSSNGSVDVAVLDRADEVELTVRDYGVGIAPSELTRIFDRFTRGSSAATTAEGVGLGLFICKRIVDGHGGRIWAESTLGSGTTFHAVFPKHVE